MNLISSPSSLSRGPEVWDEAESSWPLSTWLVALAVRPHLWMLSESHLINTVKDVCHSHRVGNSKSFRASVPGMKTIDKTCISYYKLQYHSQDNLSPFGLTQNQLISNLNYIWNISPSLPFDATQSEHWYSSTSALLCCPEASLRFHLHSRGDYKKGVTHWGSS